MGLSIVPLLVIAVTLFPSALAYRALRNRVITGNQALILYAYSLGMLAWATAIGTAASFGFLVTDEFLSLVPGIWLPLVPIAIVSVPLLFRFVREPLIAVSRATPTHWFASFQALRVTAIGTAIKSYLGLFPEMVEYLVGVPDLLFGASAFWMAAKLKQGQVSRSMWVAWNLIGFAIIIPIGCIVINLSLPGPLQLFAEPPTFLVAFEFPMSLAPTAVVPWFVAANLWGAMQWPEESKPRVRADSGETPNSSSKARREPKA
ncbi:MAG: hypothetical protein AAFU85_18090 [Planctomycetota bacterium]